MMGYSKTFEKGQIFANNNHNNNSSSEIRLRVNRLNQQAHINGTKY